MELSQNGIDLIKGFEGFRSEAYQDCVKVWTIGYGHIKNVHQGQVITQDQGEQLLREDCQKFVNHVNKFYPLYNWNQNQFDALVSFAFNIGSITQLTANGTRTNDVIAKKMLEYCKAGGKEIPGLVARRQKEQELFLTGYENLAESKQIETSNSNTYSLTSSLIVRGNKGESVKWLQHQLKQLGYDLDIDGIFGKNTLMYVKAFQQKNGLVVDGKVGKNTLKALY